MRMTIRYGAKWVAAVALLLVLPAGIAAAQQATSAVAQGKALSFGLLPYLNTRTLIATYHPLGAFLERETGRPVHLATAPDLETFARRTYAGEYDIALIPPHYGRIAEIDYGFVHLLSYRQRNEALLMTARANPLRSIDDLRGASLAIIERSSLLGILAARWLADHGLAEGKDYRFVEAGTHSNALHHAVSGKARAAIIWRTVLQKSAPDLQRDAAIFGDVIYTAPSYSLIASKRLTVTERKAVHAAVLKFEQSDAGHAFFAGVAHGGYREPSRDDAKLLDRITPETRRLLGSAVP